MLDVGVTACMSVLAGAELEDAQAAVRGEGLSGPPLKLNKTVCCVHVTVALSITGHLASGFQGQKGTSDEQITTM